MRIGVDSRALAERPASGITFYARELIPRLAKLAQNDTLVLFSSGMRRSARAVIPTLSESEVTSCHIRVPNKLFNSSLSILHRPQLDRLCGASDIFFAPNLHFLSVSRSCKFVVAIHDLSFVHFPHLYSFKGRLWHKSIRPRALLERADAVIAMSEATKRDVVETYGIESKKITVIYSGFNLESVNDHVEIPGSNGQKKKYFFALGGADERKNISAAIEAYRMLPHDMQNEYDFNIAGKALWKTDSAAKKSAKHTPGVHFLGYITQQKKLKYLKGATALVYPSVYEGFGLPLLEAMSVGTPVITSNVSSMPEVVGDAAILIDPHDVSTISEAMRNIISDPELHKTYTLRGNERVKKFTWDKTAQETYALFQQLMS
ncbi:glycosyltransferase family 4 protein [Patescibacteria group bacterium]